MRGFRAVAKMRQRREELGDRGGEKAQLCGASFTHMGLIIIMLNLGGWATHQGLCLSGKCAHTYVHVCSACG